MSYHEARVDATFLDQKCREVTVGGVHESLLPPLTDVGQLVDTYGQVVQYLQGRGSLAWILSLNKNIPSS